MGAFMFFTMGYYFKQMKSKEWKKSLWIVGAILADLVRLYKKTERFTKMPSRMEIVPAVAVITLLAVNMMGILMPFSVEYQSIFSTPQEVISELTGAVLPSILEILGIAGGSELKSTGGLMQLLICAMLAAMVYSCVMIFLCERTETGSGEES